MSEAERELLVMMASALAEQPMWPETQRKLNAAIDAVSKITAQADRIPGKANMIRLQQILENLEGELVNAQAEGWSREACVSVVQMLAMRWNVYVPPTKAEVDALLAVELLDHERRAIAHEGSTGQSGDDRRER